MDTNFYYGTSKDRKRVEIAVAGNKFQISNYSPKHGKTHANGQIQAQNQKPPSVTLGERRRYSAMAPSGVDDGAVIVGPLSSELPWSSLQWEKRG